MTRRLCYSPDLQRLVLHDESAACGALSVVDAVCIGRMLTVAPPWTCACNITPGTAWRLCLNTQLLTCRLPV